jgi:hypothetical protein
MKALVYLVYVDLKEIRKDEDILSGFEGLFCEFFFLPLTYVGNTPTDALEYNRCTMS